MITFIFVLYKQNMIECIMLVSYILINKHFCTDRYLTRKTHYIIYFFKYTLLLLFISATYK